MKRLIILYFIILGLQLSGCGSTGEIPGTSSVTYCKDVTECKQWCDANVMLRDCSLINAANQLAALQLCRIENAAEIRSCYYGNPDK